MTTQTRATPGSVWLVPETVAADPIGCEWLVVREHVDDSGLLLLVPLTTCPFVGTADVRGIGLSCPYICHCGLSLWVRRDHLERDGVPSWSGEEQPWPRVLSECRQRLADLARGRFHDTYGTNAVDCDPNYEEHIDEVAAVGEAISGKWGR